MTKQIKWPEYLHYSHRDYDPLFLIMGFVPSKRDIDALLVLYPDCDPRYPPWKEMWYELNEEGYHEDELADKHPRAVLRMLAQARAAKQNSKRLGLRMSTTTWMSEPRRCCSSTSTGASSGSPSS